MKSVPTFTATIYVGFKRRETGFTHTLMECEAICQEYVDLVSLCVTVTPTKFVYKNGNEPGAAVGLINYPRFYSTPEQIREQALALADRLMKELGQYRVSVVFPGETVMLSSLGSAALGD